MLDFLRRTITLEISGQLAVSIITICVLLCLIPDIITLAHPYLATTGVISSKMELLERLSNRICQMIADEKDTLRIPHLSANSKESLATFDDRRRR